MNSTTGGQNLSRSIHASNHHKINYWYKMTSTFPLRSISQSSQLSDRSMLSTNMQSEYGSDDETYMYNDDEDDYEYNDDDGSEASQEHNIIEKHREFSNDSKNDKVVMMDVIALVPVMNRRAESITEALNIPTEAALPCLRKCGWDKQRLMQSFFDNSQKLTEDAGVYHRCRVTTTSDDHVPGNETKTNDCAQYTCQICFDDLPKDRMYAMPCEHYYCLDCWSCYVATKIEEGPACIGTTCPDIKCKELVTEAEVKLVAPQLLDKFVSYQLRNFIEDRSTSRWCPGRDCKYIATLTGTHTLSEHSMPVFCRGCSTSFCLGCGDTPHAPLTCKDISEWKENYETTGSESWILQNTKPCPKCRVRIEKNQGCNHMTCKQCHHEFCWICNGDWKNHSQCNRFDENSAQGKDRELARNLHYVKRYQIHGEAQQFAEKVLEEVRGKLMNSIFSVEDGETLAMVEELKEPVVRANEELVECRRTLKHTYIYAYKYLQKAESDADADADANANADDVVNQGKTKILCEQFEYHQEMLERFTEELSELTEKPLKLIAKLEIVNKTEGVKKFRDGIVSFVMNEMCEIS